MTDPMRAAGCAWPPRVGQRVRNIQPDGRPGHSFREVEQVNPRKARLVGYGRSAGVAPYWVARADFERYWMEDGR